MRRMIWVVWAFISCSQVIDSGTSTDADTLVITSINEAGSPVFITVHQQKGQSLEELKSLVFYILQDDKSYDTVTLERYEPRLYNEGYLLYFRGKKLPKEGRIQLKTHYKNQEVLAESSIPKLTPIINNARFISTHRYQGYYEFDITYPEGYLMHDIKYYLTNNANPDKIHYANFNYEDKFYRSSNKQNKTIRINKNWDIPTLNKTYTLYIKLQTITQAQYLFQTSFKEQTDDANLLELISGGKDRAIVSNIKNGFGIFSISQPVYWSTTL